MLGFIVCGIGLRTASDSARGATGPARISASTLTLAMTAGGTVCAQTIHSQNFTTGTCGRGLSPPRWQGHSTARSALAPA